MINNIPIEPMKKEEAKAWFIDYCNSIDKMLEERRSIIENDDYINWLYNLLLEREFMEVLYNQESDNRLKAFFEIINQYGYKRYISTYEFDGKRFYYVLYRDMIIKIGYDIKDVNKYFVSVNKEEIENREVFLYEDIKKEEIEGSMSEEFQKLGDQVTNLRRLGATDEDIVHVLSLRKKS